MTGTPDSRIRRIVILGGGTAGWITAGLIAARYRQRGDDGLQIALVESVALGTIGVGEGTWPSIRETLRQIGLSETEFLTSCDASFKQGSRFVGWVDGAPHDAYLHPFTLPVLDGDALTRWMGHPHQGRTFADALSFQSAACDAGLAPKAMTHPEYAGAVSYAYHFDAGKFAQMLARHVTSRLGVEHHDAAIASVEARPDGDIAALIATDGRRFAGDLFIDCSGLAARLIAGHCQVPFTSCRDVLFANRAWTTQLPYPAPDAPIASTTNATAQAAGWIWDIGLQSRRGLGHVYSDAHQSDDDALAALHAYVRAAGGDADALTYRRIAFEPGHRQRFWQGNCIAVGLSAGFIEPMEATAIALIEMGARMIGDVLPATRDGLARAARQYNACFEYRWARIIDFLKLHYVLNRREGSDFWRENRRAASIPASLAEALAAWRHQCPAPVDFAHREELFPAASYQYILYGMGAWSAPPPRLDGATDALVAERVAACARMADALATTLRPNRETLQTIARYGLKAI